MRLPHFVLALSLVALSTLPACSTFVYPGGPTVRGAIYTNIESAVQDLSFPLDPTAKPIKRGEARTRSILGLFAWGDGSVSSAMEDGGITRIHHINHAVKEIVYGVYQADTTIVYGE